MKNMEFFDSFVIFFSSFSLCVSAIRMMKTKMHRKNLKPIQTESNAFSVFRSVWRTCVFVYGQENKNFRSVCKCIISIFQIILFFYVLSSQFVCCSFNAYFCPFNIYFWANFSFFFLMFFLDVVRLFYFYKVHLMDNNQKHTFTCNIGHCCAENAADPEYYCHQSKRTRIFIHFSRLC